MLLDINHSMYGLLMVPNSTKKQRSIHFPLNSQSIHNIEFYSIKELNLYKEGLEALLNQSRTGHSHSPVPRGCFLAEVHAFLLLHVKTAMST